MAHLFRIDRVNNKIGFPFHTASTILGLDGSKDLESLAIPLIVANGGTGLATITDGGLLLGSGTGAITPLAQATNGQLPIGSTGADPILATLTGSSSLNVANGAGSITLSVLMAGLDLARVAGSTYSTIQHLQNLFHSAGWVSGGVVSDNGDNTVAVTAGTGVIRASVGATQEILFFDWALNNSLSVPANTTRYVGVEYNAGSPQLVVRTSDNFNSDTDFILASLINESSVIHIQKEEHAVGDHSNNMIQRLFDTAPFARDNRGGGLILGESGDNNRNLTMTAGTIWEKLNEFSIGNIDTSVGGGDTFDRYLTDGSGGHTKQSAQTTWDNTQFDSSGTLTTMITNRYAVQWYYIELDGAFVSMYGTAQYTSEASAETESPPVDIPDRISLHSKLIGRIIFRKSDTVPESVESVFTQTFTAAGITDHGNLAGLADDDHTQYLLANGTRALAGAWDMGSQALTNVNIDSGVITGITDLAVVDGGTGASNAGDARTNLGVGTGDSPQFTGIELGHASDTTITRVSAGIIAVEGTTVMLVGDAPTSHTIVSHSDTTGTGAELNTLTGGGDVGALHTHAAAYQPLDAELTSLAALSYVAASFVKMTGANTFALRTLQETSDDLEATIDHDNLLNFTSNEHYLQSAIITVGTIGTGTWQSTDIGIGYGGTGQSTAQLAINALSAVSGATNEHVLTKDTGTGNAIFKAAAGGTDEKVKIDVGATADYIGAANSDGVLRTTTGLSYADGGNFVTLGLSFLGLEALSDPGGDRLLFWDDSESAFKWNSPSTGLVIATTSLGLNFGALTEETTPDVLDVVCIYDPTGGAHHKVQLSNLKALSAYTDEDSDGNVLLKGPGHSYKAATDGLVYVYILTGAAGTSLKGYVGLTDDPIGAGMLIQPINIPVLNYDVPIQFAVAKDEYFEITTSSTPVILWKSFGTLSKPVDQD